MKFRVRPHYLIYVKNKWILCYKTYFSLCQFAKTHYLCIVKRK